MRSVILISSLMRIFPNISYHYLTCIGALFIALCLNNTFNATFYQAAIESNFGYLNTYIQILHAIILMLGLEILCVRVSVKYVLGFVLILSSICAYYMDTLGVMINEDIIQSIMQTHLEQTLDMMNLGLITYVVVFGIIPCVLLAGIKLTKPSFRRATKQKVIIISLLCIAITLSYISLGKDIVFVFKAQKHLENMPNPIAPIRSSFLYYQHSQESSFTPTLIAQDAHLAPNTPPQIVLFVIGESTRSANFSLNGYEKITNPYTSTLNVISFKNFYSCGVVTAISVPCLLTHYTHKTYTHRNLSLYVNNILDIAQSVGYEVWYLGNNGGKCVGGCDRNLTNILLYPSNSLDEVMLPDIEHIIKNAQKKRQNTFIVAHQYGSHGASYAERYPKAFEHFTPVCKQKELSKCTYEEIVNAYDNSILYNDYLLSQMVGMLENVSMPSMLWYVSDHGESLGELGLYMHGGLSYTFAPKYQKHIPSIMWFSKSQQAEAAIAKTHIDSELSHDNVFHTLLHILRIQTTAYDKTLDILQP